MAGIESLFEGARMIGSQVVAPIISMSSDNGDDIPLLQEYMELRTRTFADYLQSVVEDERYYKEEFGSDLIPTEWQSRDFKPTVPPTAYNAVEAAANHILTTPDILIPERPTEVDFAVEQAVASLKSSALLFFWHQVFKQGDPLGHAKKDVIKHGKMVLKKVIDYDNMQNFTAIGRRRFPWCVYQIAPTQIFEDPSNPYDPSYLYDAYETTREEAERLFPEAHGNWKNKKAFEKVRCLEYWEKPHDSSKGARKIWIDDTRVLNKPNPYFWLLGIDDAGHNIYDGYIPYFIGDSGWGDGDIGASPNERYVGLIRRVHSLLETEARQMTASDAQLRISTFPILNLKGIAEDDEQPIKIGPGAKIHTDETQDVTVVQWPQLDPALFSLLTRVHNYVNELTQFQTLSGTPQAGVDSATEADQNFRSASARLAGPIAALKSIITRVNETVFMDIEHIFKEPVTLYGALDGAPGMVTILPQWIDGFYENFVELKTSDQKALDAANAVRWANLFQVFNLDRKYAMKMAGIPNPQQRIAQRMQEDVLLDPQMHQLRVAQAMQQQGGEFGEMLAMNIINQMLNGQPPTGMEQPGDDTGMGAAVEPLAQSAGTAPMMPGQGGFAGGGLQPGGEQTAPGLTAPPVQQNAARAVGFNRAMMSRPDLAYGG